MHKVVEDHWQISAASVRGKGHVDANLPNQDSVSIATSGDGRVVAIVVSDGAGTAAHAEVGSKTTTEFMAPCLLNIGVEILDQRLPITMVKDRVLQTIIELRSRLSTFDGTLRDYHCTLIACLITPSGGMICQIGDSIALTTRFAVLGDAPESLVDFFPDDDCRRYEPDRGEYANETSFLTQADWANHLRLLPLPDDFDAIVLMTDGAMDIATLRGKVYRGFMSNLTGKLLTLPAREQRNGLMHDWLAARETYGVTADDKTLCIAIRAGCLQLAGRSVDTTEPGGVPMRSAMAQKIPPKAANAASISPLTSVPASSAALPSASVATPSRAQSSTGPMQPRGATRSASTPPSAKQVTKSTTEFSPQSPPPSMPPRRGAWLLGLGTILLMAVAGLLGWSLHAASPSIWLLGAKPGQPTPSPSIPNANRETGQTPAAASSLEPASAPSQAASTVSPAVAVPKPHDAAIAAPSTTGASAVTTTPGTVAARHRAGPPSAKATPTTEARGKPKQEAAKTTPTKKNSRVDDMTVPNGKADDKVPDKTTTDATQSADGP